MTDRPILFSAEMVRAILHGRKTQTRRVVKLTADGHVQAPSKHLRWYPTDPGAIQACRYGQAGDLLWVRETWARHASGVDYAADFAAVSRPQAGPWRPSIHMPRWASRITLRTTDIRVERLQDISEDDARAEGAMWHDGGTYWHSGWSHDYSDVHADAYSSFARLWNKINGPGAWDANPWVWAISFERVKP